MRGVVMEREAFGRRRTVAVRGDAETTRATVMDYPRRTSRRWTKGSSVWSRRIGNARERRRRCSNARSR